MHDTIAFTIIGLGEKKFKLVNKAEADNIDVDCILKGFSIIDSCYLLEFLPSYFTAEVIVAIQKIDCKDFFYECFD